MRIFLPVSQPGWLDMNETCFGVRGTGTSIADHAPIRRSWPEDAHKRGLFDGLHELLGDDAWLAGRVTGREYTTLDAYRDYTDQRHVREPGLAGPDATVYGVVLDVHGKIALGARRYSATVDRGRARRKSLRPHLVASVSTPEQLPRPIEGPELIGDGAGVTIDPRRRPELFQGLNPRRPRHGKS